jgi:hypothetical protein
MLANRRQPSANVATSTQNAIFGADEPREAKQHDARKPTPSVATLSWNTKLIKEKPWDATPHETGKQTPTQNVIFCEAVTGKPNDTTLANLRRASRRRLDTKQSKEESRDATPRFCQNDAGHCDASRSAIFSVDELKKAKEHDASKPTPFVETPVVTMLT